jgi:outer membrane protein OmpA-like peptidoglycan-associated protein
LISLTVLGTGTKAYAQGAGEVPGDFGTERFQLATDKDGILDVESATVRRHLELDMALWLGYANDPLVLDRTDAGRMEVGSLVSDQVDGELVGSIGVLGRGQVAVVVPLIFLQDESISSNVNAPTAPSGSFALGDIRLVPKLQLLSQGDYGVNLAILASLTVPTSTGDGFAGDTSVTFSPAVALSHRFDTGMRTGLMAGYRTREKNMALDLEVNDEVFAAVGAGYDFAARGGPPVGVDAAFSLATAADDMFGAFNRNYAEVKVGGSVDVPGPLLAFVATGFGVAEGWGTPDWRALAGVRVDRGATEAPKPPRIVDTDKDGLLDNVDACPLEPEDKDGFEDTDGCPDTDDDKDGIPDVSDGCRMEPEDIDQFEDSDGCPEEDNDKDKILDANDKCPNDAEDVDGFEDDDGCPDNDNDNDTVLDPQDQCPEVAGPVENNGCPWPDRDGDGVIDKFDNCPTWKGKPENNGCAAKQLVKITESKLELYETIYFATGRATIQRRSFRMLNQIADVIKSHSELVIRIEGHTDSVGSNAYNLKLSQSRADAVMKYLVKRGVEQSRLSAQGFGEEQPIADNKTSKGRAQNRRVEFMATRTVETIQPAAAIPGQTAPATPATPAPATPAPTNPSGLEKP